jgi:hypothetical protein
MPAPANSGHDGLNATALVLYPDRTDVGWTQTDNFRKGPIVQRAFSLETDSLLTEFVLRFLIKPAGIGRFCAKRIPQTIVNLNFLSPDQ